MSLTNPQTDPGELDVGSNTLRRRLLRFILLPLLFSLIVAGSISYFTARKETAEVYDAQLTLLAKVLYSLAYQQDNDEDNNTISQYDTILPSADRGDFSYRIWLGDKLVLASPNAKNISANVSTPGFSDAVRNSKRWRVFVSVDTENAITVEVAGRQEPRDDIIQEILLLMFIPLLLVLPVIAGFVWFGVIKGLKPINHLSDLIKRRDPRNLSPLSTSELPQAAIPGEIAPLVRSLNDLMIRMRSVLESEQKFTDHAAHELRTPLAAIKVQAQVALRTTDGEEKKQMLVDLVEGVNRATHLVSQLLDLARAQSQQGGMQAVNVNEILSGVVNGFADQFNARAQKLHLEIAKDVRIQANGELLAALFRNLIDNAGKYSPSGSTINIRLTRAGDAVVFEVENPGPGIPENQQSNVFDRFYRLPGSNESGCGLGLAMVKQVCEIHNAQLDLKSGGKDGLTRFTVTFPA